MSASGIHDPVPHGDDVAAGYDLWSSTYDRDDNPMIAMADRALGALLPQVAGRRVLELGCGTGRNASAILAAGAAAYVGIDSSAGMLARARERGDVGATWMQADLLDRPAAIPAVDVVLFSLVLEHVADLRAAFSRASAALVPGGLVFASEIHPGLRASGTQAHFRRGDCEVALTSHPHTMADFVAAIAAAGLELAATTDWYPTNADLATSAKLARHLGRPVLVTVQARHSMAP